MWIRTRTSHKNKQNLSQKEIGQADLDMLEWAAAVGDIQLKYLDESGFSFGHKSAIPGLKEGNRNELNKQKRKVEDSISVGFLN